VEFDADPPSARDVIADVGFGVLLDDDEVHPDQTIQMRHAGSDMTVPPPPSRANSH
jgi:hypothetical protein